MSLDFIRIAKKDKGATIYPDFKTTRRVTDLMVKGGAFFAIWDEERGIWSKDEYDVQRLVDRELFEYNEKRDNEFNVATLESNSTNMWHEFKKYVKQLPDNYVELDRKIIFANSDVNKEDYASMRLPYNLAECDISAYNKMMDTLYDKSERDKIEWAIGAIISGDSRRIQKFIVFYGESGSGKSTVMNIIEDLFTCDKKREEQYWATFEAKALGAGNNRFALEAFKDNPLVAIQHDGDLSRIEDNTKLNSLISHEKMSVDAKYRAIYETRFDSFLFMGTNTPVRITDARSGMNRRLIDVHPSNRKLPYHEYMELKERIKFELGGIAKHCLDRYNEMGSGYYNNYIPLDMISGTNHFYDYVLENSEYFKTETFVSLKSAWASYKEYVDYARVPYPHTLQKFKEELKAYFDEFYVTKTVDGQHVRNSYFGFRKDKIDIYEVNAGVSEQTSNCWIKLSESGTSVFDILADDYPAQYATESGIPTTKWRSCQTALKDISTSQLHFVKVPTNHIVIDFDIKGADGKKSLEKNLKAASKFPETYAEVSKSGEGLHLHYIYDGDPEKLSRIYAPGIEIKVFTGDSSLRRQLTKFHNTQVSHIASGLPIKEESKMINFNSFKSEKALRTFILRNLNKEYHPGTKPSIDFIFKGLNEAYDSGLRYDVTDMRPAIQTFALNSSNHPEYCLKLVCEMKFASEEFDELTPATEDDVFFDVEIFPNVFIVCYKFAGEGKSVVKLINPSVHDIEELIQHPLIGFNNRNYDNHMLYAAAMGYSPIDLYHLSKRIIEGSPNSKFGPAYNISKTDVYDYASKKQSLKKWEIELDLYHLENAYAWDEPLDESHWEEVANYCANDVLATEALHNHLVDDFLARKILARIAGGTVNDTTNSLTTKLIFGSERHPQLVYTDLATGQQFPAMENPYSEGIKMDFPGYEFIDGKNMYRGESIGFGGYIRSWPGIYYNVALLDVASMHPTSAIVMNAFGEYTERFKAIKDARVAIKHGNLDEAKQILSIFVDISLLEELLSDKKSAKGLAQALKIAINSVYGLTAAKFDNAFRDSRNANNIVALRGALFMKTLRDEIEARGYSIVAIKTDSIKIANADQSIIDFCMEFGRKYGYEFEHEDTYEKICQINDADYIAKTIQGEWTVTGKQFAIPYVYKTLFTHEPIVFKDLCETKEVKSALYLDMNEKLPEGESDLHFIGRIGSFCPIKEGCGGGILLRDKGDGGFAAATGSKGYRWLEAYAVDMLGREDDIDHGYFRKLVDDAIDNISQYGDFYDFAA